MLGSYLRCLLRSELTIVFVLLLAVAPVQDAMAAEKGLPDRAKQLLLQDVFLSGNVIAQKEVQLWHLVEQRGHTGDWVGPVQGNWFHLEWSALNDFLFANGYLQLAGPGDQAPCGYGPGVCGPTKTWWLRPLKPADKLKPFILRMEDTAPYRILRETGYMPTIPGMPKGRVALALLRRQLKDIEKVERRQSGDVDSWQVLFAYDVVGFPEAPKRTFKAVAVANFNRFTERWNVAVQPLDAENPATEAFNQWLKTDGAKWEAEAKKLSSAPAPPSMSPPTVENWLQQILRDPATRAAPLVGTGPSPGAQGRFTWHPKEGGLLVTSGLPSTPPGKSYQLWAIRSGVPPVPIPVGTFGVDNKGRGILFRPALPGVENTDAFAVTLETVDGVPSPTGGIYLWSGTR